MEKTYLNDLEELKKEADRISNTPMMSLGKVLMLVMLNMRYEKIMVDRNLKEHPYKLTIGLILDSIKFLKMWNDISFIENSVKNMDVREKANLEDGHKKLFQKLWVNFDRKEYENRIERYIYRLKINDLDGSWLRGFRCIDFGCGHGNFAHALVRQGAEYVYAIDYGEDSIKYAIDARNRLGINEDKIEFKFESVYKISKPDNVFDFAIQNGVFHHLEDENAAICEVRRVLKSGGWFWYYTDGSGAISHDLWDASLFILRDIPHDFMLGVLGKLNLETGKRYHLGDGLNAVYRHTSWDEITSRLSRLGFANFRRLKGGFPTDFDHDVIMADKYGRDKFGEGDLRLLAQKL